MCSDPTPTLCNTGFGIIASPLLSAALQNRLAAGFCKYKYTYEDFLFTAVCSNPPPGTAALIGAKCFPHCSVLLCTTGWQQACVSADTFYEDVVSIQVCNDSLHCSTGLGKMYPPLFSAALQDRVTADLRHCSYTCGDLLFIQVCSQLICSSYKLICSSYRCGVS